MGFFKSKKTIPVQAAAPTVSAEDIRAQEESKIKAENLQAIQSQESQRQKLRSRLSATEDEEGEVQKKRLFGE